MFGFGGECRDTCYMICSLLRSLRGKDRRRLEAISSGVRGINDSPLGVTPMASQTFQNPKLLKSHVKHNHFFPTPL